MREITLLEKYFPKNWDDLILPQRIKNILNENRSKKGFRLLLHSSPGTGKTTTSRIMTTGDEYQVMYLSGSNDFNIETFRNKVVGFASGMSVLKKQKTIIIDESENIRDNLQDSFKIILDQCVNVNFIFITNEIGKMNEAIRSRCTNIEYDFSGEDLIEQQRNFINFTINICKTEKIEYDKAGIKALYQLNFPDFRHLLVNLQQIVDSHEPVTLESIKKFSESGKKIFELYDIVQNPGINGKDLYAEMSKFKGKEKECFLSLGEPFFEYLNEKNFYDKTLEVAIIISKYCDSYNNTINKFVSLLSCIVELKSLFR
jgi:replication-associated recombination protein RarA